jgi:hypothetical protein
MSVAACVQKNACSNNSAFWLENAKFRKSMLKLYLPCNESNIFKLFFYKQSSNRLYEIFQIFNLMLKFLKIIYYLEDIMLI